MANEKSNERLDKKLVREDLDRTMPGWQDGTSWDKVMAIRAARTKAREEGTLRELPSLPDMAANSPKEPLTRLKKKRPDIHDQM